MTGTYFLHSYFEKSTTKRVKRNIFNRFYHKSLEKHIRFIIPENAKVLELGCGNGDLLNAVKPSKGVGVDFSEKTIEIARNNHPHLQFVTSTVEDFAGIEKFEYIIISDLLSSLWDIQDFLKNLRKNIAPQTRVIINNFNYVWEPFFRIAQFLGLKTRQPHQSWLTIKDIENLLYLENFEIIKVDKKLLFPLRIPIFNFLINKVFANLPFFNRLSLIHLYTAKPTVKEKKELSVSIVVPARNEKGNIENAIKRTPEFGSSQEFIFIEGNSKDGTYDEMLRMQKAYPDKEIQVLKQSGKGKGNAVREAFEVATKNVLMILDADLTTPPEDMPKFYEAIATGKGEFINGCRLVYPMEKQAMRFLNYMGNKFFGWFFTYLLGQRLKDTLCGTKVLLKTDYEKIKANRKFFGEFDPFGDFDLLFGASKLNLKITEVIVRYRDREYGSTQISRFRHGILLFRMSFFAARKIKFR